jgi:predicted hydrocarbon binding protein
VDQQIHSIVRKTAPGALTPGLGVHEDGDATVIAYTSSRRLCVYLGGLIEGTAGYFGEAARLEEQTCMLRGDSACLFRVLLTPMAG